MEVVFLRELQDESFFSSYVDWCFLLNSSCQWWTWNATLLSFFFSDETADDLASATSYSCPAGGAATPAGSGRHRPHITVMTTGKSGGKVSSLAARWRVPGHRSRQGSECAIAAGGQTPGSCISHHEITYVPTSALKEIDHSDRKHEVSSNTDISRYDEENVSEVWYPNWKL